MEKQERLTYPQISIHAPAKGATLSVLTILWHGYFNPRSREGSDEALNGNRMYGMLISIHAPAKGATYMTLTFDDPKSISIHAPAKGATAFINIFSLTVRLFLFHLANKI